MAIFDILILTFAHHCPKELKAELYHYLTQA